MNFQKINNITGWIVCLIACSVYVATAEAAGSLWDCGEFVSSCFKVQIPHPPGAPLFVLLGRIAIVLFGDDPLTAAKAVNIMNALASGFAILFLFWSITHLARKIVLGKESCSTATLTNGQIVSIIGAGLVGALAYTFSDSFWYSAVEGEVYALSSFFTAIVFWAALKWEEQADEPGADKWLVFLFFMVGLSIGVHLLSLLNIPAVVMLYYFRRRHMLNYKVIRKYCIWIMLIVGMLATIAVYISARGESRPEYDIYTDNTMTGLMFFGTLIGIGLLFVMEKINPAKKELYGGAYLFFIIACIITVAVQLVVIQYSVKIAGFFDVHFVNDLGLPFYSGFITFFLLLIAVIGFGLRIAAKKGLPYLRLALWCLTFILLGYSPYVTTMIRSNADPSIDMYNVDNPMTLVDYLSREQYGEAPLLYGQKFTSGPYDIKFGATKYKKGSDGKYVATGKSVRYLYPESGKMVFPRMWDASNEQFHYDYYASSMGYYKMTDGSYHNPDTGEELIESSRPDFGDNLSFFIGYQNYYMYFRYFMWNFSGKQNDIKGSSIGNVRDGNWITGIPFVDNLIYGDQKLMPDSLKNNKAHNTLFLLPFILGMIGLFYHFKKKGDDALVTFLLFFFTGFAIVMYLNPPGNQPRERDYAYVGSFYVFAIWIGLGVLRVKEWCEKLVNQTTAAAMATTICLLAVPVLMAQQEWDDHDRSNKKTAPDLGRNYLESCAPNAILFCYGDNDTYPLWYAQEVEGVRPDIRVINTSLLGIDWYINQLRYKLNQSDAIDAIWTKSQIEGSKRDYVYSAQNVMRVAQDVLAQKSRDMTPEDAVKVQKIMQGIDPNKYYDLYEIMSKHVGSDDPAYTYSGGGEDRVNFMPTSKVFVPVDTNLVRQNKTVNIDDNVLTAVQIDMPAQRGFQKNETAMYNIIAANKWKRPIYFTTPYASLGFDQYLRKDGLSYRLVPVALKSRINIDWSMDKLMNTFRFGNANLKNVYFDEENRRHLSNIRRAYAETASNLAVANRKEEAKKLLHKADAMMLQENIAYGMTTVHNEHNRSSLEFLQACYLAGDIDLATKVKKSIKTDLDQQLIFYASLSDRKMAGMLQEKNIAEKCLQEIAQIEGQFNKK